MISKSSRGEIMKSWTELQEDAFSYFEWFCKSRAIKMVESVPKLSVFSIIGSRIYGLEQKNRFFLYCNQEVTNIFKKEELLSQYKFYLYANIDAHNLSKIALYRKVWKLLQQKWPLEGFILGPEIEVTISNRVYFASVAEFNLIDFTKAVEICASNPKMYSIIASKKQTLLTEDSIRTFFSIAFNEKIDFSEQIDQFSLSLHFCPQGDIVFRWGDSSEEAELDLIFNEDMLLLFRQFTA